MMYQPSNLEARQERESTAALALEKMLKAYQETGTPESRATYLQGLRAFSRLVTGRE